MRVSIGNLSDGVMGEPNDSERAVLPAIIWASKTLKGGGRDLVTFHAWALAIGWWKWGIRISHNYYREKKL